MPQQRLPMHKIRDVLRLTASGLSSRKVAASLSVGATTVIDCLQRARAAGAVWPLRPAEGQVRVINGGRSHSWHRPERLGRRVRLDRGFELPADSRAEIPHLRLRSTEFRGLFSGRVLNGSSPSPKSRAIRQSRCRSLPSGLRLRGSIPSVIPAAHYFADDIRTETTPL
jgi:hypothetical protein